MSFKLNGTPYDKDNMNIGVYRRDLKDGSAGKSNHTGIIVDKDVSKEMEDAVIAHETVHQHQQRNGELDYDDNNFYWKGKTYPRKNLNEHNENLPWEKEAYKESNKILAQKNNDMKQSFKLTGYRGNGPAFKNLEPIRLSIPMALATSCTLAPVASHSSDNELMEDTRCAKKALAVSLESSEDHTLVVSIFSFGTQLAYTSTKACIAS